MRPADLPTTVVPAPPSTGDQKLDQKYQQQQDKLVQTEPGTRKQQKQDQEHQRGRPRQNADEEQNGPRSNSVISNRRQQIKQRHVQQQRRMQEGSSRKTTVSPSRTQGARKSGNVLNQGMAVSQVAPHRRAKSVILQFVSKWSLTSLFRRTADSGRCKRKSSNGSIHADKLVAECHMLRPILSLFSAPFPFSCCLDHTSQADKQLAHDIYKGFVEIRSGSAAGSTTPVAEAAAARFACRGFSDSDVFCGSATQRRRKPCRSPYHGTDGPSSLSCW